MGARGDRPSGDRIVAVIEGQGWLDKPSYKIEHGMALVSNLLGPAGVRVRDFLHGRWFGHPLHPLLTDIPVGAWTAALVLDGMAVLAEGELGTAASPRCPPRHPAACWPGSSTSMTRKRQAMTDAHEVLIDHHRVLRTMMRRFDELLSAPAPDRRQLLNTLSAELQIHEQIEDELYYPAVRDLTPLVWLAHAEHRQLEDQLAVVLRTPLDSEPFPDEWRTLVHTLEGHATEEETGMFPEAGAYLGTDELQALGQALQARQAQLRRSRLVQARHWLKRETLRRL